MNNVKYELSIVIISWKMKELLEKCLHSIYRYTKNINFEIILIDNNSLDGTSEMIQKDFPEAKLIINEENKGVAPARNQGLAIAQGKYILILDADIELVENSINQLFEFMESNQNCGLSGCKLVDSDKNLQFSCKRFPSLKALLYRRLEQYDFIKNSKVLRYHTMRDWDHNCVKEVDYLIGACQFFRKEVIEKIGLYDAKIFYGPEDIDFCIRVQKAGWKILYYPMTSMIHHEQRITKKNLFSAISLKHIKGIIYLYWKYKGKIGIN